MKKPQRLELISRVLASRDIRSQKSLCAILAEMGLEVSQATLSRDMKEIGVVRDAMGRYRLPRGALEHLRVSQIKQIMRMMVKEVLYSGNIVVIKTNPGQAHTVASALDTFGLQGIIGTVAGDDTVFAVIQNGFEAEVVCKSIAKLAGT